MSDNHASEFASRVQAMDNSSKNAGEMLDKLTLQYNRSRQATITTELIEIISGAEALKGWKWTLQLLWWVILDVYLKFIAAISSMWSTE